MPTIFEIFGLRFFFYSDEHLPIHVHIEYGGNDAKVEIEATELTAPAVESFADYIAQQTLAVDVKAVAAPSGAFVVDSDIDEVPLKIAVTKA